MRLRGRWIPGPRLRAAAGISISSSGGVLRRWRGLKARPTGSDTTQAQILHFEELLDPVLRSFAADAGFFHTAERCALGRVEARVAVDDAVFASLCHAPDPGNVAAVTVRREAEPGGVGEGNRVGLRLEAEQRCHWPEGFLAGDEHLGRDAREHRRLEEAPANPAAADGHARPF